MKKILATLLSVLLVILPLAASAESDSGYASLKIIDPVLSYSGVTIDFTGLELDLSAAVDGTDPENPSMTLAAAVLANGEEALSGVVAMDITEAAFLVNGMQSAYKVLIEDVLESSGMTTDEIMESFAAGWSAGMASADIDEDAFAEEFMGILDIGEAVDGEVEYNGATITVPMVTVTMGKPELIAVYEKLFEMMGMGEQGAELIQQIDAMIEDMAVTITAYEIDENTVVEDIDMKITSEGETIVGNGRFTVATPASGEGVDMVGTMTLAPEDNEDDEVITMDISMMVAETGEFEGATTVSFEMAVEAPTEEDGSMVMKANVTPKAVADGFHYDYNFDFSVEDVNMNILGSTENAGGKLASDLTFSVKDGLTDVNFGYTLTGDLTTENGDQVVRGDVKISGVAEGMEVALDAKYETVTSENVEGRLIDIASLNALNLMEQSMEDMEAFQNEFMGVVGAASMKLMEIPGVAAIMGGMMGEDAGAAAEM